MPGVGQRVPPAVFSNRASQITIQVEVVGAGNVPALVLPPALQRIGEGKAAVEDHGIAVFR